MRGTAPNLDTPVFIVPANSELQFGQYGSMITNLEATGSLSIRLNGGNKTRFNEGDKYELKNGENFGDIRLINDTGVSITVTVGIGSGNISVSNTVAVTGTVDVDEQSGATLVTTADDSIAATTTEQVLVANSLRKKAIIGNLSTNTDLIRVGDSNTGAARGQEVLPGGAIELETEAAIYVYNAKGSAQSVSIVEIRR